MKNILILAVILFLSAQTAWAEIGGSVRGFMESEYARECNLNFSPTRVIGDSAPSDLHRYAGYYEHSFAQEIGRTNYDYGLILVSEQKAGEKISAQKLTFETPMNQGQLEVIYKFVIDHINEATGGKVSLNEEKLYAMMRESIKGGESLEKIDDFIITVKTSSYREHMGASGERMVYLTGILIRK